MSQLDEHRAREPGRGRRVAAVIVCLTALLVVAAAGAMAIVERVAAPRDLLIPRSGALFGAFVGMTGVPTPEASERAVAAFESTIGRKLDVDHHFYPWAVPFPTAVERWDLANDRIPMISWHGDDTIAIASGSQDPLIRSRAIAVRNLDAPVFLRWGWEMDGGRNAPWVHSPSAYIAAWRHLRQIFTDEGATNAIWVFCPNAYGFTTGRAQAYFPGAAYVDWVCADGYNWAPDRKNAPWEPFDRIFARFSTWATKVAKPAMIGETGALERQPGEKAAWLQAAYTSVRRSMPAVHAVVYFNIDKLESDGASYDWRVTSSESALQAFIAVSRDPYFTTR